jgi:3-hydroxy-9,10-secoandrosta-1,3,5(10)-triene-9,17-dione monooxygenase
VQLGIAKELVGRAYDLQPVIAARAAETELNRAPLDATIKDLIDAEFVKTLTPKRFGGFELNIDTMVEIARIFATACPSTGWISSFYIGHTWLHSVFPEESQVEVFAAGPAILSSGQIAPTAKIKKVTGGFEVSGRQAWSSGVVHADWIFFTGMMAEDGESPKPMMVCLPREQVEVIDTWFIAGMQGTGSRDVAVHEVFVPNHHAVPYGDLLSGEHPGRNIHANPLYHMPAASVLGFETLPVLAGALRGAAEAFLQLTRDRTTSYTGASVAAKPAAQMRVGRGFAMAEAVEALTRDAVTTAIAAGCSSSVDARAALRMRAATITKLACDAVNDIMHGAGGNSFRNDAPLQRFFRDVNVLRTHAILDVEPSSEIYGRILLGMNPGGPM